MPSSEETGARARSPGQAVWCLGVMRTSQSHASASTTALSLVTPSLHFGPFNFVSFAVRVQGQMPILSPHPHDTGLRCGVGVGTLTWSSLIIHVAAS